MANIITDIQLSGITYQIQGDVTVDAALDSGSTNPVANSAITTAIDDKQDTLVSSQNIKTINNESILGSGNIDIQGGGKAVSGGTNISITTGETADTINCTLPISADSKGIYTTSTYPFLSTSNKSGNVVFGYNNRLDTFGSSKSSNNNLFFGSNNYISVNGSGMLIGGLNNQNSGNYSNMTACVALGGSNNVGNPYEFASGQFNVTHFNSTSFGDSGNTLFSVGNGKSASARHNAFEIRQNGDIYLTLDGQDVKLQDHLGGGSSYTAGDGIDITNDVISVTGKVDTTTYNTYTAATDTALNGKADTSAVTEVSDALTAHTANTTVHTTAAEKTSWNGAVTDIATVSGQVSTNTTNIATVSAATTANTTALGGLSLIKLTQAEYDALSPNYDSNTLYVIVN